MQCIICKKDKPHDKFTEEHIFPDSIGGNIILDCVCKECNDFLGHSVDSNLVNHVFVQFNRLALKIAGKSGKIPNPLAEGYINDSQEKIQYIFNNSGIPKELRIFPKIQIFSGDNGILEIQIDADVKDRDKLTSIINKKLKRLGLDDLSKEEKQKIENAQPLPGERPLIRKTLAIDIFRYKRAIIKIAYELAYYWLGATYLNDEIGELLRLSIMDNSLEGLWLKKYPIDANIDLIGEKTIFPYWTDEKDHHIGLIQRLDSNLICCIKIFNIFQGIIIISKNAHLYPTFIDKFIAINAQTQESRESDLETELLKITESIITHSGIEF
ncbi:HNH endonuclease [uncultured Nostoc sp.]|uniref:HNH endonuclease n=1 Tax=uncultured Nostoc sp. TaxID=340711 RepID=UPI002606325B|nr:HNH endonuclease [uncultured Nostoc sp.]